MKIHIKYRVFFGFMIVAFYTIYVFIILRGIDTRLYPAIPSLYAPTFSKAKADSLAHTLSIVGIKTDEGVSAEELKILSAKKRAQDSTSNNKPTHWIDSYFAVPEQNTVYVLYVYANPGGYGFGIYEHLSWVYKIAEKDNEGQKRWYITDVFSDSSSENINKIYLWRQIFQEIIHKTKIPLSRLQAYEIDSTAISQEYLDKSR